MPNKCVIAENDPFIAQLLQRFAEETGLQVIQARTGREVLLHANEDDLLVLLIEVELPGEVPGWQAVQMLRSMRSGPLPIISCSWLPESNAAKLVPGLAGHLQKPELHYADFLAVLAAAGIAVPIRPADSAAA
jgi:DNA-binding response OmpR family regulator